MYKKILFFNWHHCTINKTRSAILWKSYVWYEILIKLISILFNTTQFVGIPIVCTVHYDRDTYMVKCQRESMDSPLYIITPGCASVDQHTGQIQGAVLALYTCTETENVKTDIVFCNFIYTVHIICFEWETKVYLLLREIKKLLLHFAFSRQRNTQQYIFYQINLEALLVQIKSYRGVIFLNRSCLTGRWVHWTSEGQTRLAL